MFNISDPSIKNNDKKLKAPYPGRPKTSDYSNPHQNNNREYIRKQLTLSFETIQEVENFENMIKNLKIKTGESRQDKLVMMGFKILEDLTKKKIKIINIEEEKGE